MTKYFSFYQLIQTTSKCIHLVHTFCTCTQSFKRFESFRHSYTNSNTLRNMAIGYGLNITRTKCKSHFTFNFLSIKCDMHAWAKLYGLFG